MSKQFRTIFTLATAVAASMAIISFAPASANAGYKKTKCEHRCYDQHSRRHHHHKKDVTLSVDHKKLVITVTKNKNFKKNKHYARREANRFMNKYGKHHHFKITKTLSVDHKKLVVTITKERIHTRPHRSMRRPGRMQSAMFSRRVMPGRHHFGHRHHGPTVTLSVDHKKLVKTYSFNNGRHHGHKGGVMSVGHFGDHSKGGHGKGGFGGKSFGMSGGGGHGGGKGGPR